MNEAPVAPKAKPNDQDVFLQRVRPDLWRNPVPRDPYDFAILGAGPAGIAAAELAARLGFTVALIERNRIGGNSLNSGSVPSKAIIKTARIYSTLHEAEAFAAPMLRVRPNTSARVTKLSQHEADRGEF